MPPFTCPHCGMHPCQCNVHDDPGGYDTPDDDPPTNDPSTDDE